MTFCQVTLGCQWPRQWHGWRIGPDGRFLAVLGSSCRIRPWNPHQNLPEFSHFLAEARFGNLQTCTLAVAEMIGAVRSVSAGSVLHNCPLLASKLGRVIPAQSARACQFESHIHLKQVGGDFSTTIFLWENIKIYRFIQRFDPFWKANRNTFGPRRIKSCAKEIS